MRDSTRKLMELTGALGVIKHVRSEYKQDTNDLVTDEQIVTAYREGVEAGACGDHIFSGPYSGWKDTPIQACAWGVGWRHSMAQKSPEYADAFGRPDGSRRCDRLHVNGSRCLRSPGHDGFCVSATGSGGSWK